MRNVYRAAVLAGMLLMLLGGCGGSAAPSAFPPPTASAETAALIQTDGEEAATKETGEDETMLYIRIGDTTLTAEPAGTEAAEALLELLESGPVTIRVENYGGFEKVGQLPRALPRNDTRITTRPGDIMLYQGDSIVLFYGSNTWSYTRLGRIAETGDTDLAALLGGPETEITLSR